MGSVYKTEGKEEWVGNGYKTGRNGWEMGIRQGGKVGGVHI